MRFVVALLLVAVLFQTVFELLTRFLKCAAIPEIMVSDRKVSLKFSNCRASLRYFKAEILLENVYTGEITKIKTGKNFLAKDGSAFEAAIECVDCGLVKACITEFQTGILTAFFPKKAACRTVGQCLVMPKISENAIVFSQLSNADSDLTRSIYGNSDGAREYRHGEKFSDIHMKLSAKCGKYMVREKIGGADRTLKIEFIYEKGFAIENAEILNRALNNCLAVGLCAAVYCGNKCFKVNGEWDIEPTFCGIFSQNGVSVNENFVTDLKIFGGKAVIQ